MGDFECVGTVEEAVRCAERGAIADICEGGLIGYKAEVGEGEGGGGVAGGRVVVTGGAIGGAGEAGVSPDWLVREFVEAQHVGWWEGFAVGDEIAWSAGKFVAGVVVREGFCGGGFGDLD